MKFAAFGRTQWLFDSIQAAIREGHQVVLIGTSAPAPEYTVNEGDFARLADEQGCAYFCDSLINRPKYVQLISATGAEVAISVNWPTIIEKTIFDQFHYGVINAHAGDLPRFRGNAVANWAILKGEKKVVLTLHQMSIELDAGPILLQREFPLTPKTYISEVYQFLEKNIPEMFVEVLNGLGAGNVVPKEQPSGPELCLRCFPRQSTDSKIDWNHPAVFLARLVRASAEPFSGAYSFLNTQKIVIWRAHPEQLPYNYFGIPGQVTEIRCKTGEVAVLTGDGVLVLEEVEMNPLGRRKATDIIRSTRSRLGMCLEENVMRLNERVAELEARINKLEPKPTDFSEDL